MSTKTAIIAGATGLVGGHLINQLLVDNNYSHIRSVGRKSSGITHPKLEEIIVSLDDLDSVKDSLRGEVIFCCLGTTMAKAGSREAFEKVDYEYPLKLAMLTKQNNSSHYVLVSAMGAKKNSLFYYNRIKGQTEEAIGNVNFEFYTIIRPSMILGERKEKRVFEELAKYLTKVMKPILIGPFKKLGGVEAKKIAESMRAAALLTDQKERIIYSNQIGSKLI